MKKTGIYAGGTYQYDDIKDYDKCCTCVNFCNNWHEERFECLSENRDSEDCYKSKY